MYIYTMTHTQTQNTMSNTQHWTRRENAKLASSHQKFVYNIAKIALTSPIDGTVDSNICARHDNEFGVVEIVINDKNIFDMTTVKQALRNVYGEENVSTYFAPHGFPVIAVQVIQ